MTIKELIMTDTKQTVMTRNIILFVGGILHSILFVILAINLAEIRIFASTIAGISIFGTILRALVIIRFLKSEEVT